MMLITHALFWPKLPWIFVLFFAMLAARYARLYRQAEHRREHDRQADLEYIDELQMRRDSAADCVEACRQALRKERNENASLRKCLIAIRQATDEAFEKNAR